MERREFFKKSQKVAVAAAAFSVVGVSNKAFSAECSEELPVGVQIGTNHGHDLKLDAKELIKLLRQTKTPPAVELSIQGRSGHPHTITLSHVDLLEVLIEGELIVKSSFVSGHEHDVAISFDIQQP